MVVIAIVDVGAVVVIILQVFWEGGVIVVTVVGLLFVRLLLQLLFIYALGGFGGCY